MEIIHTPVLLEETIRYLAPRKNRELMVDATLGEGGHSCAFLSRFPELRIIGIDADEAIQKVARERLREFGDRIEFYSGWSHAFFAEYAGSALSPKERPDTVLVDLGVSSYHYEQAGRGFSFRKDEPLDMRIDPGQGESAAELIAGLSERDLADLIYQNAEERYSRRIARAIGEERSRGRITSSAALAEIVWRASPPAYRRGRTHPATKTFQALRIAVNREISALPGLLEQVLRALKPGGRMGVISFHSGEDRIVKNFFRLKSKDFFAQGDVPIKKDRGGDRNWSGPSETGRPGGKAVNILTPKPVVPGEGEMRSNPPSRSAKLRVVEKLLDGEEK
ncbi:MAG: 16S rRNA (cytosine(1402)-N(4))-methyltransferase RsmH [Treponema sp.]|jgi:16S rRNA (cytosine1402-N4)-methyltransferase|nr:16S rRNA (cytosine(1402)-N(4))-methyltransferase RsmH [Treponema sp.]